MEPPRPLTDAETKIVRIFKQAAENHAAVKGIKTQWSIYHLSREAGLDLSAYPKESLIIQAVWIAFLSVMKSYTPDVELKYPTQAEFQLAYAGRFDTYNSYEQTNLWTIANWMSVLSTFVPAKKNKGFALTVVTKLIEGWYVKYVTGSGQTRSTQDRVHIFEVEGNTKPSPRGKGNLLNQANITTLKMRSGSSANGSQTDAESMISGVTSRSSGSSVTSSNSPVDSSYGRPLSPPVSSPRSGDQGVGNGSKRRKSIGKAASSFPAYGPENNLFATATSINTFSSLGSSPKTSSGLFMAAAAPQPAPSVATSMMMFNPGKNSSQARGTSMKKSAVGVCSQQPGNLFIPPPAEVPLFRGISSTDSSPHTHNNFTLYRPVIDSGASDITDNDNDTYIETDTETEMSYKYDDFLFENDPNSPRNCGGNGFLTLADVQAAAQMQQQQQPIDQSVEYGEFMCVDNNTDDVEFQEMLKLLRETSTSSTGFRQTSLHFKDSANACCLVPTATEMISFNAIPSTVPLGELGPPLLFPYTVTDSLNGLSLGLEEFQPPMQQQQQPQQQQQKSQVGFNLLGMNFNFGIPDAFDLDPQY